LWSKAAALDNIRWHLIGHLQRNKIRRTLPLVRLIQSVDSRRLLDAINEEAAALGRPTDVLLEANISGDVSKTGLPPEELEPLLHDADAWPQVNIRGLMGMASLEGGDAAAARDFEALRLLRDRLARNAPPGVLLVELSMGMSGDYEIAIAEGATIVRVGSALFEGVAK
jgi:pyridoxal phosphate enzyme (YggS family)